MPTSRTGLHGPSHNHGNAAVHNSSHCFFYISSDKLIFFYIYVVLKTQSTSVYMWGNSVQKDWGEKKMEGVEVVDGLGYFYIEVAMQSKTCILKTHYRCGWRHPFESFHRSWPRASTGLCPPVLWGLSWQVDLNFLN